MDMTPMLDSEAEAEQALKSEKTPPLTPHYPRVHSLGCQLGQFDLPVSFGNDSKGSPLLPSASTTPNDDRALEENPDRLKVYLRTCTAAEGDSKIRVSAYSQFHIKAWQSCICHLRAGYYGSQQISCTFRNFAKLYRC